MTFDPDELAGRLRDSMAGQRYRLLDPLPVRAGMRLRLTGWIDSIAIALVQRDHLRLACVLWRIRIRRRNDR